MTIICWGNLAKSADDTQRIEQSIQAYVEAHDENVNAHMGADYSLGAHRLQNTLDHPYGSIRYWHVTDLHAEAITAGGLVIKGAGPYISVQDEASNERVKIYPEGIIVKNGLISVQNDGDQVIIDKKGLWGSNIFYSNQVQKTDEQEVTGDFNWYFLTSLQHGFYLTRPSPVLVWGFITAKNTGNDASAEITVQYPGGYWPAGKQLSIKGLTDANTNWNNITFITHILLNAGNNWIRLLGARSTPDETVIFDGLNNLCSFGYMIMGN